MLDQTGAIPLGSVLSEFLTFFNSLFNRANEIESSFWKMVIFTVQDAFKASNCIFEADKLARCASKDFGNMEWLSQEALNFPGASHGQLIFF